MARSEKIAISLVFLLVCCALYVQFAAAPVGDKDVLLLEAHMLLAGKKLYVDMLEINPPLIVWLYTLPDFLAVHLGFLKNSQALIVLGTGLAAFSILLCAQLLRLHPELRRNAFVWRWHVWLLIFVLFAAINPAAFMDREHLFMLLVFPYVLRFLPSLSETQISKSHRAVIGCMAAIGFCIKPHCAIFFAGIQILRLIRTPRVMILFCLENIIIYSVAILYMASVFLFTPDYITRILPMVFATYLGQSARVNGLFFLVVIFVVLGVALADFKWRATTPYRRDIYYLFGLAPALFLYALANNGWGYTYNPLFMLTLIISGWIGMEYLWLKDDAMQRKESARQFIFGSRACALSLVFILAGSIIGYLWTVLFGCTQHINCTRMGRELVAVMQGKHSFGAISGNSGVWVSLSDATGATIDTRTALWMMPKFFLSGEDFTRAHRDIPEYVANAFADDLNNRKPPIMFVDNMGVMFMTPVYADILAYFNAYPRFRDAWSHYRHTQTIFTCMHPETVHCAFEVYSREP